MREDIFGGLKNALDKGDDLEKAVRSFIGAGYPEAEVRLAAQALTSGTPEQPQNPQQQTQRQIPQQIQGQSSQKGFQQQKGQWPVQNVQNKPAPVNQVQPPREIKPKGKTDWKLIILISVLLILMAVLFGSFFLKEKITEFFANIF